jgi:hypothetical protein
MNLKFKTPWTGGRRALLPVLAIAATAIAAGTVVAASVPPTQQPKETGPAACPDGLTPLRSGEGSLAAGPGSTSDANINVSWNAYAAGGPPAANNSAVDWPLNTPGYKIFYVKVIDGVDGQNVYDYRPDGVSSDTFLTTPGPTQGPYTFKGISHIDFCYAEVPLEPLTAEKTAEGSYDRTVEWTLEKSVDPNSHTGDAGEDAGSSDWTVVVDKSETLGNYEVKGSITIDNPNDVAVDVSVSDVLDDSTVAGVDCDPDTDGNQSTGTVPADGQLVCSYKALPDDDSAELNTAEITSLTEGVDGAEATADVAFVENLVGDDEVTLGDERFTHSELINDDTTEVFPETFPCPSDPSEYVNGVHERTETNVATLIGDNTDLSAQAEVTITCLLPVADLHVRKFYDADMDGLKDAGEAYITGWRVFVNGDDYLTPADLLGIPVGDYEVEEDTPNEANWIHTTPTSKSITLAGGDDETVEFGNVCIGAGGGMTLGFWSNKNGEKIGKDDLPALNALNLVKEDGSPFDPGNSYAAFRSWLLNANANNMAYMLSAQLAAMKLNVLNAKVDGTSLIYAPGTDSANALGFATVNAVMAEANDELGDHNTANAGDAWRSYQEALKNALDKANNNLNFVQDEPCPFTFPELETQS